MRACMFSSVTSVRRPAKTGLSDFLSEANAGDHYADDVSSNRREIRPVEMVHERTELAGDVRPGFWNSRDW